MRGRRLFALCLVACTSVAAVAQDMTGILEMVAGDSPRLKAASQTLSLQQAGNARERVLDDPEFEFGMLWGNDQTGNRHDISVTQSIDLATLSGKKGDLANSLDRQAGYQYESEKIEVLYNARLMLADLVYYNALIEILTEQQSAMESLYEKTGRSLKEGGSTALDMGKVRLQLSSARTAKSMAVTERMAVLESLRGISGHPELDFSGTGFECDMPSDDFDSWLSGAVHRSPLMRYVKWGIESEAIQLDIDRMAWVPKLDLGYMAELARDEKYRGVTVGVSVPLWSNTSNVRRSRAAINQAKADGDWQEQEFRTQAANAWNRACSFADIARESQDALEQSDNRALLAKALEHGELSVLDYLMELGLYYDAAKDNLQVQREYHHALSELARY